MSSACSMVRSISAGTSFEAWGHLTTRWRPTFDCFLPSLSLRSVAVKRGSARALGGTMPMPYVLTETEFVEGMKFLQRRKALRQVGSLAVLMIAIFAAMQFGWDQPFGYLLIGLCGAMAGYTLMQLLLLPMHAREAYRVEPLCRSKCEVAYGPEGLDVRVGDGGTRTSWDALRRWRETDDLFLIFYDEARAQTIPKRIFESQSEQDDFRGYLAQHIRK
jgi:hypothetical protein